jgi:hypothetical protein
VTTDLLGRQTEAAIGLLKVVGILEGESYEAKRTWMKSSHI